MTSFVHNAMHEGRVVRQMSKRKAVITATLSMPLLYDGFLFVLFLFRFGNVPVKISLKDVMRFTKHHMIFL